MQNWLDSAVALQEELIRVRRHLHQNPEPGFQEHDTANYICEYLQSLGIDHERVGQTGVVATLDTGRKGPTVALRADMDALPVIEESDCEYRSQRSGFMHACGHDAHTATLLVTGRFLKQHLDLFDGRVKLLFQAAEESPPGGAVDLIKAGALQGVDAVYGLHVTPELPVGQIGIITGPMMAAADRFSIKIIGRGGHGASPHQTTDAVLVGCQLVNNLQSIVSRNLNPLDSAVVTVGQIKSGFRFNVIAETCVMDGTVRTLTPETRKMVRERLDEIVKGTVQAHKAGYELEYEHGYPALINPQEGADTVRHVGRQVLGEAGVHELPWPSMGGEDFAYYLEQVPGAFFRLGIRLSSREQFPLHNSRFDLDERALVHGLRMFAGLVMHHCARS